MKDERGVSEVVGSILILLMTVVLFSGIILWISSLPTPEPISRVDIATEFNPIDTHLDDPPTWDKVYLNLTHKGGEKLMSNAVEFYLIVNNTVSVLKTRGTGYGITGSDADWNIGEIWQYRNDSLRYYQKIRIMLVDRYRGSVLWEKNLWGYEGTRPPIFIEKWTDGNPNSTTRDPVEDNKTDIATGNRTPFGVFAKVTDLDGNLDKNKVYLRFTFGPLEGQSFQMTDNGSAFLCDSMANDSLFSVCNYNFWPSQQDWLSWNGGIMLLNATDLTSRTTNTRLVLNVYNYGDRLTQNIYENETNINQTVSGNYSKPSEYAIFDEVEWVAYGQGYVITNNDTKGSEYYNKSIYNFNHTDLIQVKVLSNILDNAYKSNVFRLYDATTGNLLVYPSNLTFTHVGIVASYHKYQLNFTAQNISGFNVNTGGCYNVYMELRDTDDDYFMANTYIEVKKGVAPYANATCPKMKLYSDSNYTYKTQFFNSWDFMYIEITPGNNTDVTVQSISVEIQDFWGGTQVNKGPIGYIASCNTGGVTPVSGICINATANTYRLRIDLLKADNDAWLLGNASYTVYLRILSDSNEYYESISANVYIFSPPSIMDMVYGHEKASNAAQTEKYYGHFAENVGGWWNVRAFAFVPGAPSADDPIGEIYSVSFTDMDNDGDKDIVVASAGGNNAPKDSRLAIYDNYGGKGYFSRTEIDTYDNGNDFTSVATGDVNGDGRWDIVAGTTNGLVFYYANDGTWDRTSTVANLGSPVGSGATNGGHGIAIAKLDADRYAEIVIATSGGVYVFKNQTNNYSNWDQKWTSASGCPDFASVAVGDVGYPDGSDNARKDIVTGCTNGQSYAYLQRSITDFVQATVEGTAHTATVAAVGIGNIDGTGFNDIVVGNGDDIFIYTTTGGAHGTSWSHFGNDDTSAATTRPNAGGAIGGNVMSMQVGNIDGAIQDDIAISTDNGRVYYYRNIRNGGDWKRFLADDLAARLGAASDIYCLSIGDMNQSNPTT